MVDSWLYLRYTVCMKTAISLPDQLYQEAEKTAHTLGIPRSQLFAKALEDFIALHKRENITERLNLVYSKIDQNEFQAISDASVAAIRNLTKNDTW
jgi:metal-responsive CopG/Arc/MetJ family transcriptional regulator